MISEPGGSSSNSSTPTAPSGTLAGVMSQAVMIPVSGSAAICALYPSRRCDDVLRPCRAWGSTRACQIVCVRVWVHGFLAG